MSIFDKLFGHENQPHPPQPQATPPQGQPMQPPPQGYQATNQPMTDDQAIARYRYMLRTAPPETIEQAHQEAFAQLTPEQRKQVLGQLSSSLPPGERAPADDPQSLARAATRAEVRQPGTLERIFGSSGPTSAGAAPGAGGGSGIGLGTMIGGSLLSSLAGAFIGTAIADHFFRSPMGSGFFGGGGGFGGGGYGGGTVINETNNYYDNPSGQDSADADKDQYASSDDASTTDDADSTDDTADTDDSTDDSYDDSGSDDGGGFDDGGGSFDDSN